MPVTTAIAKVRRLVPAARCAGVFDPHVGATVYRVFGERGALGIGRSAQQAWLAAAEFLRAPELPADDLPDEGDRYLDGRDVQELIGADLRKQGRLP
jgi:hypothetical protein